MTSGDRHTPRPDTRVPGESPRRGGLAWLLPEQPLTTPERRAVIEQLFFGGAERRPYLIRFSALMFLSVAIASFGLMADSSAVVIGAMLVAPLMTPILAVSAATVMVWPVRQIAALIQVLAAAAGSVLLAGLISWVLASRDPLLSNEVVSRTQPTMLDLGVALAAGAAAAYVTVRTKAGGALPGVAIAVALVPPLSTAGILMPRGEWNLMGEALLLFATNFFAIVLAAMLVFLATGFHPTYGTPGRARQIRIGLALSVLLVAAVAYPLWQQGQSLVGDLRDTRLIESRVTDALEREGAGVVLLNTDIDTDAEPPVVTLDLAGPEDERPDEDLLEIAADNMAADLGRELQLRVHYTVALVQNGDPEEGRSGAPPGGG